MIINLLLAGLVVASGLALHAADEADIARFREARFGLFIHWGLYAQPGGRWKGRTMDYIGEWIQSRFRIPNAEYARLAETFNPVFFDADDWARQAKAAGVEYVVLTTKHHDGFAMFATKASSYNVVDATPFRRDVFGELAAACRRQGLKVGLYYSQNLDWHEYDAADPGAGPGGRRTAVANKDMDWGNGWDWPDGTGKDFDRYLKAKVYPQLRELLTNYGEIFVIWFDCPNGMTPKQSRDLKDYVRSLQPHVLVSGRIGNGLGDFDTPGDNQLLAGKGNFPLECPMTLNDTWGFKWDDHNWKSGYRVACDLMGTLAGGANLLLNVGPRPDGRFPDASSDVLRELADWRARTGVAFRGTAASPFPQDMPWGWCTVADGNVLQFVVKSDWTNDLAVCGLRNRVKACTVPYVQEGALLKLALRPPEDAMPRVVRVTLDGAVDVDPQLMPQAGELRLVPSAAARVVAGARPNGDSSETLTEGACKVTNLGSFTRWHHPGDTIVWKTHFPKPGRYTAWVRTETWYHSRPWAGDRRVEVRLGAASVAADLAKDRPLPHTVYDRAESRIGDLAVPAAGDYELSVRTLGAGPEAPYYDLTALILEERQADAPKGRSPFAFDPSVCRIPERFRDHPLFTRPVVGVNFGFGGRRGYYAAHMDEPAKMKAAGVNWCVLKIHPMQEEFCSRKIFFDPVFTVGEQETADMIAELHRNGIHVMLQPCVMALDSATMFNSFNFPGEEECQLEGRHPSYWKAWFESQRECLTALAAFAERTRCEALIMGCEYDKTFGRTADWLETLAAVRAKYTGPVSIERGGTTPYGWLDRLDFVCISYYPPAAPLPAGGFVSAEQWNALPDVPREAMLRALREAVPPLDALHRAAKNLPVVLTEAGMTGVHGWCREPWNGMGPHQKGVRIDHREQADYTDAFFETFVARPYCPGICLWKWDEAQPRWFRRDNPAEDGGFSIPGKPVEGVLRKWAKLAGRQGND